MNKILYSNNEFWLLQDWPEDPKYCWGKPDCCRGGRCESLAFDEAIEQSKSNKIKIANPELLSPTQNIMLVYQRGFPYWWHRGLKRPIKDGDTFDFPEGLKVDFDMVRNAQQAEWTNIAILSKEDNSAHSHTEGSEDKPDFKPEILRWLREDFVTIKELPDKFTLNDIINCALYIADYAHKTKPKEEESQEELVKEIEAYLLKNISGNGLQIMRFIEYLKQHFRIERIKTLEK